MARRPTSKAPAASMPILQLKVRLIGVSPMVWRRLLVESSATLEELHGVLQVAMGWEAIHLYQFELRAVAFGSLQLGVGSPGVTLDSFALRKGSKLTYIYDMGDYWRHEVRVENQLSAKPGQPYPHCAAGAHACPPEDCGGPDGYRGRRAEATDIDAMDDLSTLHETFAELLAAGSTASLNDAQTSWRFEHAVERTEARAPFLADEFSRTEINDRLRRGKHNLLMYQQI